MNLPTPLLFVCQYGQFSHAMLMVMSGSLFFTRGNLDHSGVYKRRWKQELPLADNPELRSLWQGNCWDISEVYAFVGEFCGEQAEGVTDEHQAVVS